MRVWLLHQRKKYSRSQSDIAEKADITQQIYSAIEKGERSPSVTVSKKIASELDLDWALFYQDEKQCKKSPPQ